MKDLIKLELYLDVDTGLLYDSEGSLFVPDMSYYNAEFKPAHFTIKDNKVIDDNLK